MSNCNAEQPPPKRTNSTPIWSLVIADMHDRSEMGFEKYGTHLTADNGRDHLRVAIAKAKGHRPSQGLKVEVIS